MRLLCVYSGKDPLFKDVAFVDALHIEVAARTSERFGVSIRAQDVKRVSTTDARGKVRIEFTAELVDDGKKLRVVKGKGKPPKGEHPAAAERAVAMGPVS